MKYIQLPFNFIIKNSYPINELKISLSTYTYFSNLRNEEINFPYPKPSITEENYINKLEEWQILCLNNIDFRKQFREKIILNIEEVYKNLICTKEFPTNTNHFFQDLSDYKFYHKEIIDIWLLVWENVNLELESLETLLLFKVYLNNFCLNEKAINDDKIRRNEMWNKDFEDNASEEKHWSENGYNEGGGGDEWSDPF
jgi:hypothetical protein